MKKNTALQYTIRRIPPRVDRVLRKRCRQTGKSFNEVALEAIAAGAGEKVRPERDFSEVIGSLSKKEAAEIEREILRQHSVDPELWK